MGAAGPEPPARPEAAVPEGQTLFTALGQLGLKLIKSKGVPVDVLVIDRVDKIPSEN
jgi:uncharacterized protein (TIGR03435 family)